MRVMSFCVVQLFIFAPSVITAPEHLSSQFNNFSTHQTHSHTKTVLFLFGFIVFDSWIMCLGILYLNADHIFSVPDSMTSFFCCLRDRKLAKQ